MTRTNSELSIQDLTADYRYLGLDLFPQHIADFFIDTDEAALPLARSTGPFDLLERKLYQDFWYDHDQHTIGLRTDLVTRSGPLLRHFVAFDTRRTVLQIGYSPDAERLRIQFAPELYYHADRSMERLNLFALTPDTIFTVF